MDQLPPVALLHHPVLSRGEVISAMYVVLASRAALENLKEAGKTNLNMFDVT